MVAGQAVWPASHLMPPPSDRPPTPSARRFPRSWPARTSAHPGGLPGGTDPDLAHAGEVGYQPVAGDGHPGDAVPGASDAGPPEFLQAVRGVDSWPAARRWQVARRVVARGRRRQRRGVYWRRGCCAVPGC